MFIAANIRTKKLLASGERHKGRQTISQVMRQFYDFKKISDR